MTIDGLYTKTIIPWRLREEVIKRCGDKCYRCDINDERPRQMVIHHLDFNETNNHKGNLIYLCHTCHRAIHGASFRPMGWNKHFYIKDQQKQRRLYDSSR